MIVLTARVASQNRVPSSLEGRVAEALSFQLDSCTSLDTKNKELVSNSDRPTRLRLCLSGSSAAMSLTALPDELILEIAAYLIRPKDAKAFAIGVANRTIFAACEPLIKPYAARKNHYDEMVKHFGAAAPKEEEWTFDADFYNAMVHGIMTSEIERSRPRRNKKLHGTGREPRLGLSQSEQSYGAFRANDNPDMEFLRPLFGDGKLGWLPPAKTTPATAGPGLHNDEHNHKQLNAEQITQLRSQVQRLGIQIPEAWFTFMSSRAHQYGIYGLEVGQFYCRMQEEENRRFVDLRKCPPSVDQGAGGYMLVFYFEERYERCWTALYLSPGEEGHCVLEFSWDPARRVPADKTPTRSSEDPVFPNVDNETGLRYASVDQDDLIGVAGGDFEEWLAGLWIREWCQGECMGGTRNMVENDFGRKRGVLWQWVVHNYSEKGL